MKVRADVQEPDQLIFVMRAIRSCIEKNRLDGWFEYGEPPVCEVYVWAVKTGWSAKVKDHPNAD